MRKDNRENRLHRGLLQSGDGLITEVFETNSQKIKFRASFNLSDILISHLKNHPEQIIFSQRSRIARLGIQLKCEPPHRDYLNHKTLELTFTASSVISNYPSLAVFKNFFAKGFAIERLVFCDPKALLTSDEILDAVERSELKLPASTTIADNNTIFVVPHKCLYYLRDSITKENLSCILFSDDGREILNQFQFRKKVSSIRILPKNGVITTCSMFLNQHYIVLQSSIEFGRHLPSTVLDPVKTRGIHIFLEIVNESNKPIVNPRISAKVYRLASEKTMIRSRKKAKKEDILFSFRELKKFEHRFDSVKSTTCNFVDRPLAVIRDKKEGLNNAQIYLNGPNETCSATESECISARLNLSHENLCNNTNATSKVKKKLKKQPAAIILKYFPNMSEHRDIINLAYEGSIDSIYFYKPSFRHGPFLSQFDHNHLQEYHAFGLNVFWISELTGRTMIHTMRDGKGYFILPEKLNAFNKSMFFAFYGSNKALSKKGVERLGKIIDSLIKFWGKNIGIITGGGSGVMEHSIHLANKRSILSGANFLEITDQSLTTDVDFCQIFQSTCRHIRQKWFEIAPFPIFNVGGLGSLEELGTTFCNMKLSIMDPMPVILFDTEGGGEFWEGMKKQVSQMIKYGKSPTWIKDYLIVTNDPNKVIDAYRRLLHLL